MISARPRRPNGKRVARRWTFAEMRAEWPESNLPTELWDGEPIMSPAPSFLHQQIVDRFHDDRARTPATSGAGRSSGGGTRDVFCGGTLRGVKNHLDYIFKLGCTSIWLSPVFENVVDPHSYHGYGIQSYLRIENAFR